MAKEIHIIFSLAKNFGNVATVCRRMTSIYKYLVCSAIMQYPFFVTLCNAEPCIE